MPKQFLKQIGRGGLGKAVFFYRRYHEDGTEIPEFVLNREPYRGAPVMVAGANFGCGSSRENAPWGILDFGIKCIIAPSFADIFMNNCFKNGMLCIALPQDQVSVLMEDAKAGKELTVDLPAQTVTRETGEVHSFEVTNFRKNNLLNGLEEIGLTLLKEKEISAFETSYAQKFPFLHTRGRTAPLGMDW
jgi:3-isopropylmalate/(R)-2-methylmalate dehydratase small subunit